VTIQFARRMDSIRASDIRELLKVTERPGMISFAGGLPAPELFPVSELAAVAADLLQHEGAAALQYSTTEGHPRLREQVAARMNATLHTGVSADGILVTCGAQQGIDLTGKLFLDEGDAVLCESPTYLGAITALNAYRPRYVAVPTDDDGMIIEEFERVLVATARPKFVYVVPDFQNPTGRTWSLARRRAFLEVAARYRLPVIEDAPYAELRYGGAASPPLKALDQSDLVVFLGTFSKILAPGLRIGWVAAPRPLYEKYVLLKQGADLHTSSLAQRLISGYLERHDIDESIARMRALYRRRRDAMILAIEREFPPEVRFTRPEGGLFLWVELPAAIDARELLDTCVEREVAFVPGDSFFPGGGHRNTLRLNFSSMPNERIDEGIARLGEALRARLPQTVPGDALAAKLVGAP
jgi:2-aminoadipate transaminase